MRPFLLITGGDARFFDLAQGCIQSVRDKPDGLDCDIAFLDLGCSPEQQAWLQSHVNVVRQVDWEYTYPGRDRAPPYLRIQQARPFLHQYFPGYEVYMWIDADTWVQDWAAVRLFIEGATRRRGLAIVPELDRGSEYQYGGLPHYWHQAEGWYAAAFGEEVGKRLCSFPMLNAGVFAIHTEAPHWSAWEGALRAALYRNCSNMTDQIALNFVLYGRGLIDQTELLPAWCNWTCHYGLPRWDEKSGFLVEPYLPHTPIGILHLTGEKHVKRRVLTTSGRAIEIPLRYPPRPVATPVFRIPRSGTDETAASSGPAADSSQFVARPGDYVAPGLDHVWPDPFFPTIAIGNKSDCGWQYLRREIPHNWYVDRRAPSVGFVDRDEAHILYNTALRFQGRRALEIGGWLGWSACHLALGGVQLDIIDPIHDRPEFRSSIVGSLAAAEVAESVNLVGGESPGKVHELAAERSGKWSLFFIDGNHDAPHPLQDTVAVEPYAEDDALILFHDLASPGVAEAFNYLHQKGWHTLVYQTMQIMGAAWRGNVRPIEHFPDPSILWPLPTFLRRHPVSGWPGDTDPDQFQKEFASLFETIKPFTLLTQPRLISLYTLARRICVSDLPGHFIECGTWRGGASALLASVIKCHSRRPRRVYCFDTFEGMPEPTEIDRHMGVPANMTEFGVATLKAPVAENLDAICSRLDVHDFVVPVQGLFAETLPRIKEEIGTIALLHADADWYTSTMDVLNHLYHQVAAGGFVQFDDYGHWEGCKKAVHDFEREHGFSFSLHPIDHTGVWMKKN